MSSGSFLPPEDDLPTSRSSQRARRDRSDRPDRRARQARLEGRERPARRASNGAARRRTGWQSLLLALGIVAVVLAISGAAGAGYLWYRYNQIGREDLALSWAGANDPKNYLIVGSDDRSVVDEDADDAGAFFARDVEQGGQRSDTIMILRVDPSNESIDLVSFPRDLWVPIAGTSYSEKINAAYNGGAQRLVDTIKQNFDIDIHHYIEIDMTSFRGIVNAVDGVPMYFDTPMRDDHTGLYVDTAGCVTLDGDQAIAFVRSRYLEYIDSKGKWASDGTGDLGRVNRQQLFVRKTIDQAAGRLADFDLRAANDILSSTADNLRVDSAMDIGQMIQLGRRFANFSGDRLVTHTLPVKETHHGDAFAFELDEKGAQPIIDLFRGVPPAGANTSSTGGSTTTVRTSGDVIDEPIGVAPEQDPAAHCG